MNAPLTPWTDPQSYRDQIDYYENVALHYRRVARRAVFRKLVVEHLPAAGLGLFAGMMLTVGLAYIWALFL